MNNIRSDWEIIEELPEAGSGYKVVRSSERKGKTHKVTGPDGTVKFFGDSKLGQHPKDPARKKAFYARHKKNLAGNPYFRAFARKTWEEGGELNNMAFGGNLILEKYDNGGNVWEILPEAQNGKITLNEFRPVFTQESTMTKAPLMPLSDQAKKAAENKALTQKMENLREETRREEQRYQPSTATNVTKAGLAAASLATHNPYTMATLAGGDIATGLKYGWDAIKNFDTTQAKNAFRDFSFAALDFFPEAKAAALAKYGPKILKGTKVAKDVNIMSHALPGSTFNAARPAINAVDYGKPNPYLFPIQFQQRYNTFQSDTKPPIKIKKNGGKMSDWEIVNEWEII
jgi:hypothetical protein